MTRHAHAHAQLRKANRRIGLGSSTRTPIKNLKPFEGWHTNCMEAFIATSASEWALHMGGKANSCFLSGSDCSKLVTSTDDCVGVSNTKDVASLLSSAARTQTSDFTDNPTRRINNPGVMFDQFTGLKPNGNLNWRCYKKLVDSDDVTLLGGKANTCLNGDATKCSDLASTSHCDDYFADGSGVLNYLQRATATQSGSSPSPPPTSSPLPTPPAGPSSSMVTIIGIVVILILLGFGAFLIFRDTKKPSSSR